MSTVVAVFDVPGMTSAQYDQVMSDLEAAGAGSPRGRPQLIRLWRIN